MSRVMKPGSWGYPLNEHNCYDFWRYNTLVKPSAKMAENTYACLKKVVRIAATIDVEKRERLMDLA
jgi:hypothetical protein